MKKFLISIIITLVVSFLFWILSSIIWRISAPKHAASPTPPTHTSTSTSPAPAMSNDPSTYNMKKELGHTVNVYDSTGNVLRMGFINARGTILYLENEGQFDLTNSNNQQYRYMTIEQLQGKGVLYVTKLK